MNTSDLQPIRSSQSRAMKYLPGPARQVLAELELLSHGKTQSWNASGRGGEPLFPHGESRPPHLHWRERFVSATTEALPSLIQAAREELTACRRLERREDASGTTTVTQLVIAEGDGYDVIHVAQHYGLSPAHVRRIRHKAGVNVEDGSSVSQAQKARALASQSMTQSEIAVTLRVSQPTVSRWLKGQA